MRTSYASQFTVPFLAAAEARAVRFDDVVLDQSVASPTIDGEVAVAVRLIGARVANRSGRSAK